MLIRSIDMEELKEYIKNAFDEDTELVEYYDKNANAKTVQDCIDSVIEKIQYSYTEADMFGVEVYGLKVGFFVCTEELLISFGLNVNFRDKDTLTKFWGFIKATIGANFQCVLYSHNKRGIRFLQKGGMKVLFENITILTTN